jgi:hypothetical protein
VNNPNIYNVEGDNPVNNPNIYNVEGDNPVNNPNIYNAVHYFVVIYKTKHSSHKHLRVVLV